MHSNANPGQNLPLPVGAVCVEPWYHPDKPAFESSNGEPGSLRYFIGSKWEVSRADPSEKPLLVQVDGNQYADDGLVERFVVLDGDVMTPGQARQLAAVLTAAADDIEAAIETEWARR
ncbi:hypothetical protein H7I53_14505 [Mycolicibacterium pulveris]|uniref:Uncharacterized protein n=1 Tax=Mycolicibacterium pulveris TaxID=36813 RepID=A0A7I7UM89_MYCPV|nr:hypothetical protein [Mycolicibacterium pulveris]MCV6981433.1 hypothetical protein [Mycolicibacterium pulveris]BBY82110.1 hypothetical protein MPUL_32680 [Mycolicibacterium pulveris]